MKKIIMSLAMIGAVSALVVGATGAFFSDTEESVGNSFTAGTIDIAVDDANPWSEPFVIDDFKPCRDVVQTLNVKNVGENPADIYKLITITDTDEGIMSEPECEAEGGVYDDAAEVATCAGDNFNPKDNLLDVIYYDLFVEVTDENNNVLWWQTFYTGDEKKTITDVYANETAIKLGMIQPGSNMRVEQSYHFDCEAGNEYQGDSTSYTMTFEAKQLDAPVDGVEVGYASTDLVEKDAGANDEWVIVPNGEKSVLQYKLSGAEFDFILNGTAPLADTSYTLLVGENPYESPSTACEVAQFTTGNANEVNESGVMECNTDFSNAKAWLVLTDDWDGSAFTGWTPGNYLFETALVNYEDTDL